ncbi:unnamed protein product, partial [Amoebophrya sp. A25]|eukprot:GSA25T00027702001.1
MKLFHLRPLVAWSLGAETNLVLGRSSKFLAGGARFFDQTFLEDSGGVSSEEVSEMPASEDVGRDVPYIGTIGRCSSSGQGGALYDDDPRLRQNLQYAAPEDHIYDPAALRCSRAPDEHLSEMPDNAGHDVPYVGTPDRLFSEMSCFGQQEGMEELHNLLRNGHLQLAFGLPREHHDHDEDEEVDVLDDVDGRTNPERTGGDPKPSVEKEPLVDQVHTHVDQEPEPAFYLLDEDERSTSVRDARAGGGLLEDEQVRDARAGASSFSVMQPGQGIEDEASAQTGTSACLQQGVPVVAAATYQQGGALVGQGGRDCSFLPAPIIAAGPAIMLVPVPVVPVVGAFFMQMEHQGQGAGAAQVSSAVRPGSGHNCGPRPVVYHHYNNCAVAPGGVQPPQCANFHASSSASPMPSVITETTASSPVSRPVEQAASPTPSGSAASSASSVCYDHGRQIISLSSALENNEARACLRPPSSLASPESVPEKEERSTSMEDAAAAPENIMRPHTPGRVSSQSGGGSGAPPRRP